LWIDLRTLFGNLCSISKLELFAVPQRGMPYVQMGFRIVLYISNLFSNDSFDLLPMIQYMRWSFNPSWFLLVNMCFCHVSLRSRWMPKYLAVSPCGICCPFNLQEPCVLYIGRAYRYPPNVAFYIFSSTNISTEYFKHAAHSPFFSSKCHLFHNATFFGSCIIHILHTGCAKI
jgi:hypothetical protein